MPVYRRFISLFLILLLCVSAAAEEGGADLIAKIKEQIHTEEQALQGMTNELERAQQEQRISLSRQDLESTQRRIALEEKEKSITAARRARAGAALKEALRGIDVDPVEPRRDQTVLDRMVRDLRSKRADIEERRDLLSNDPKANRERLEEVNLKLRTSDEELLAKAFQRDNIELRIRLGSEAKRISELIHTLPLNPEPTINLNLERKRYLENEQKRLEDLAGFIQMQRERKQEIATALSLSRDKFDHVDKAILLLEKQRQISDNTREIRQAIQNANSEKKELALQISAQEQQLLTLDKSMEWADQLEALVEKEVAFLAEDLVALRAKYRQLLLVPLGVIVGLVVLKLAVSWIVLPIFLKRDTLFVARRLSTYLLFLLILIVLSVFFLEDLKQIATVLGIASAAIVIALQDLCSAFAGWFVIAASRKFSIGDRVEIDGKRGDVLDIQLLRTTILEVNNWLGVDEPTGRIVLIPNNFVFKSQVFNYSHVHPYVWYNVDITVTFETPAGEAQALLFKILEEETRGEFEDAKWAASHMEKRYGIPDTVYQPKIYSFIVDSGVLFRLVYVCHYRKISGVRNRINERVIAEFERNDRMNFAYPTERHIPTPQGGGFPVTMEQGRNG